MLILFINLIPKEMEEKKLNNKRIQSMLEESNESQNLSERFEELGLEDLDLIQGGAGSGCGSFTCWIY